VEKQMELCYDVGCVKTDLRISLERNGNYNV